MKKLTALVSIALLAFACAPEEIPNPDDNKNPEDVTNPENVNNPENQNTPDDNTEYSTLSPFEYYNTTPVLESLSVYTVQGSQYSFKEIYTYNEDDLRIKAEYFTEENLTSWEEIAYSDRKVVTNYYDKEGGLQSIWTVEYLDDARTQECVTEYDNPDGTLISRKETEWSGGHPVKWTEYYPKKDNPKEKYVFAIWNLVWSDTDYTSTQHSSWASYYEDGTPTGTGSSAEGYDDTWTYLDKEKTILVKHEFLDCHSNTITSKEEYQFNDEKLCTRYQLYDVEFAEHGDGWGPLKMVQEMTYTYSGNKRIGKFTAYNYSDGEINTEAVVTETFRGNIKYSFGE